MTYLRVLLSIPSNVSLFVRRITFLFTKAFMLLITRLRSSIRLRQTTQVLRSGSSNNFLWNCPQTLLSSGLLGFSWISHCLERGQRAGVWVLFPRQINYSLFILLMESALSLCQNSEEVRHAIRAGRNIGWVRRSVRVGNKLTWVHSKEK